MKKLFIISSILGAVLSFAGCHSSEAAAEVSKTDFEVRKDQKSDFFTAPAAFQLAYADSMTKVFREVGATAITPGNFYALSAAGRERESFQLLLLPAQDMKNVTLTIDAFQHIDGKNTLPASIVSWNPIGYVRTQKSDSSFVREGWLWPDILLPSKPFEAEAGFIQPVWITVDVPHDAVPGRYTTVIHVQAEGVAAHNAMLELTVLPYSLPVRGKFKTAVCFNPGAWDIWYKPEEVAKIYNRPSEKFSFDGLYNTLPLSNVLPHETHLKIYDFFLAHRISPTSIYGGINKDCKRRIFPAKEDLEYCYARGMNATCLANVWAQPTKDKAAIEKFNTTLMTWLDEMEAFAKEKDWKDFTWYVHTFDESEMQTENDDAKRSIVDYSIRSINGVIHAKHPWVKIETANSYIPRLKQYFDVWTPLTDQFDGKDKIYAQAQADGQEVWGYVCCGPGKPYANLFVDNPGSDPRVLIWQFYQHKMTGFLYYLVNFYNSQENWNTDGPKWPEKEWNIKKCKVNGDGILIYPGPDAVPLSSIRLENLRDGIEDYEVLAILAEKLAAYRKRPDAKPQLVKQAEALLAVPGELSSGWKNYTTDPAVVRKYRALADDLIGRMQ